MSKVPVPVFKSNVSSGDRPPANSTGSGNHRRWRWDDGRVFTGVWALVAATATALNLGFVSLLERQVQTFFFEIRGVIPPPEDVIILAIDETSLAQSEFFHADPQQYGYLEPIQAWPWRRAAYATVIEKLMAAGARAIAIDLVFATPSSYGDSDDQQLTETLQRYANQVVLAAQYVDVETLQGYTTQLTTPLAQFCDTTQCFGSINFMLESDGRIHRFGNQFLTQLTQNAPRHQAQALHQLAETTPTFVDATLRAAQVSLPPSRGEHIFFYGPAQTIEQIPFWYVLEPTTWGTYLQSGAYFKDKIVLIGSTAAVHQDFHAAPFSKSWLYPQPMAGVEIHANAIATLLQGKPIAAAIPQAPLRGLAVLLIILGAGVLFSRFRQPLQRWGWAMRLAAGWLGVGYGLFVFGRLIIPTAVPVGAIALSGLSQLIAGSAKEQVKKQQLRHTLKQYVTSPIVQEIISQQDDFQDLLRERELALSGKVLAGRYKIVKVLGSGGFSETYVAEDIQRPGRPPCVVKQLRVVGKSPNALQLARRLFATEAETLEELGQHEQIPQLLASFEENEEFYLVQEFIQGQPLSKEIVPWRSPSEAHVVRLMDDLLGILEFVHNHGVIHRDLKPSNVMRRQTDDKLILIDFGVAKRITTQLAGLDSDAKFTVAVGTPGYMPGEQSAGRPHFNSDIYALGMMGIEALTRKAPHTLNHDGRTGAVLWLEQAPQVSSELAMVLNKMVHHDFTRRYQSAAAVKADLEPLMARPEVAEVMAEGEDISITAAYPETMDSTSNSSDDKTMGLPDGWMS